MRDVTDRREIKNSPHSKTSWWEVNEFYFEKLFVFQIILALENANLICTFFTTNSAFCGSEVECGKVWEHFATVCVMQHVVGRFFECLHVSKSVYWNVRGESAKGRLRNVKCKCLENSKFKRHLKSTSGVMVIEL